VEHDPTSGAGPSTTGNEHNPGEEAQAPLRAPDVAETTHADNRAAAPHGDLHRVVRGRRLEVWCLRPNQGPADRPRGN
jgi:hypothetical protein